MKILVTGARGFIGKNLIAELRNRHYDEIMRYVIQRKILLRNVIMDIDLP